MNDKINCRSICRQLTSLILLKKNFIIFISHCHVYIRAKLRARIPFFETHLITLGVRRLPLRENYGPATFARMYIHTYIHNIRLAQR